MKKHTSSLDRKTVVFKIPFFDNYFTGVMQFQSKWKVHPERSDKTKPGQLEGKEWGVESEQQSSGNEIRKQMGSNGHF